jgi:CRP/FNR family transcriptional activator FtrB
MMRPESDLAEQNTVFTAAEMVGATAWPHLHRAGDEPPISTAGEVPPVRDGVAAAELAGVPFFDGVDETVLAGIAAAATRRAFAVDAVLFRAGERAEFLYILRKGQIDLESGGDAGDVATVEVLRPAACFVLPAVVLDRPYITTARAVEPCELICVAAAALRTAARSDPAFAARMLAAVAQECRALIRQVGELKRRAVAQRLGCFLLTLARQNAAAVSDGRLLLPFGKRLLASRIGTTPEHLSRAFAQLRHYGVTTHGRRVFLANPDALASFARPDQGE